MLIPGSYMPQPQAGPVVNSASNRSITQQFQVAGFAFGGGSKLKDCSPKANNRLTRPAHKYFMACDTSHPNGHHRLLC